MQTSCWNGVEPDFYRPGAPGDTAVSETLNGAVGREGLSQYCFQDLRETSRVLEA